MPRCESTGVSHRLKGIYPPRTLIRFFELLGTYIGARLWPPGRLRNNDLLWLDIPIVTDNLLGDFILKKHYKTPRPTSWMLRETAVHNLTTNVAIISKHPEANSGKWSLFADKIIRIPPNPSGERVWKKGSKPGRSIFLVYEYQGEGYRGIKTARSINDRKVFRSHPRLKGWVGWVGVGWWWWWGAFRGLRSKSLTMRSGGGK